MPEAEASAEEHFAIPCDTLPVFIAGLLDAANMAVAVRARHRGRMSSEDVEAYAYKLDNGSIGPSTAHQGEHILECQVKTSRGIALRYHIRADREGLQTLHSLIGWYLDTPAGRGEKTLSAH